MRAYSCALLTWPAREIAPSVWDYDMRIEELVWRAVFDTSELEEVPVEHLSPAALLVKEFGIRLPPSSIIPPYHPPS